MHVFAGLAAAAAGALLTLGGCTTADGTHHHGPRQTMRDSAMPPADTRERPYDAPSHDMNRPHDRSRMPTAAHPGCADRQAETADRRRARRAAGTTASDEAHERHSAPGPRCWPGSVAYASEQARPSGRLQSCPAGSISAKPWKPWFVWCHGRGLNSRPHPYQGCALPLSYRGMSWRRGASSPRRPTMEARPGRAASPQSPSRARAGPCSPGGPAATGVLTGAFGAALSGSLSRSGQLVSARGRRDRRRC